MKSNETILKGALLYLSQMLEKHYQKKTIILIDEYDVPLQSTYINGYYNQMVDFLRSVFSSSLKTNDALEKGIIEYLRTPIGVQSKVFINANIRMYRNDHLKMYKKIYN